MAFSIKDWFTLKGAPEAKYGHAQPAKANSRFPALDWRERFSAWIAPKEALQAEIKNYRLRLHAMMMAKDEALSHALLYENDDIVRWLRDVSGKGVGALGVQIKELDAANKELTARLAVLGPSERRAWDTVDAVMEAWEHAAGIKTASWDKDTRKWVPNVQSEILPQTVHAALAAWLNRPDEPKKPARGK